MSEERSQKARSSMPKAMIEARIDWLRSELAQLEQRHAMLSGALEEVALLNDWMEGKVEADRIPKKRRLK